MGWIDVLTRAYIHAKSYAKTHGKAKIEIYLYRDRGNKIRVVVDKHRIESEQFYDKGIED